MKLTSVNNKILRHLNIYIHKTYYNIISAYEGLYLKVIGIECGKRVLFRGWVNMFKTEASTIHIGNHCSFNRSTFSNHIGLNHNCIIATHTKQARILIGNNVGVSSSTINCWDSISIGNNVRIGANCMIMDSDFHLDDPRICKPKPIMIENNVWLGANVTVMKGVTIGKNSIIGIGSIVTKDIPPNTIAAGNPCMIIKHLDDRCVNRMDNYYIL